MYEQLKDNNRVTILDIRKAKYLVEKVNLTFYELRVKNNMSEEDVDRF